MTNMMTFADALEIAVKATGRSMERISLDAGMPKCFVASTLKRVKDGKVISRTTHRKVLSVLPIVERIPHREYELIGKRLSGAAARNREAKKQGKVIPFSRASVPAPRVPLEELESSTEVELRCIRRELNEIKTLLGRLLAVWESKAS